jgi:hypothetical protein
MEERLSDKDVDPDDGLAIMAAAWNVSLASGNVEKESSMKHGRELR